MIRLLTFVRALWAKWAARTPNRARGQEVDCPNTDYAQATFDPDQEVDCPISEYTEAIQSNPNNVAAYLARGTAHLKASALDSAIEDFTKAIKLNPTNRVRLHQQGYCSL